MRVAILLDNNLFVDNPLLNKKVFVTGGNGLLGKRVVSTLKKQGAIPISPSSRECDLTDIHNFKYWLSQYKPINIIVHCAALHGNVILNQKVPADLFWANTQMGLNVIKAGFEFGVDKVVNVLSSCVYHDREREEYTEESLFKHEPHPSVECFAYAKRNIQLYSKYMRQQYGFVSVCTVLTGLYGDGCSFNLSKNKVLESLVKKFVDAKEKGEREVVLWGTGTAWREFTYVEDAARLLVEAVTKYDDSSEPLNISSDEEVTIMKLAMIIKNVVGFDGAIIFDITKPNGQIRKKLDTTRQHQLLKPHNFLPLEEGVKRTVEWYYAVRDTCN